MKGLNLERDIYPAISSGELNRVREALETLVGYAGESSNEADLLIRSFNWTWPLLTSKARASSEEGRAILSQFCLLLTKLTLNCSESLLSTVAGFKQVIRCVIRGLGSIVPDISSDYLRCLKDRILENPQVIKTVKNGFLLDKAALDNFIHVCESSEDEELVTLAEDILTRVLKSRVLYNQQVIVEYLVRISKTLNGSAASSRLVSVVLEAHQSRDMYNFFMEKVNFAIPTSIMARLSFLNFFIDIVSTNCPGDRFPISFSKSDLTASILNHKANGLISLFSLRLVHVILNRLGRHFETRHKPEVVIMIRDRLVELGSLLPVLQHYLTSPHDTRNLLFVYEIVKVIEAYKRSLPGSFSDYKFSWTKLLANGQMQIVSRRIISNLIANLASYHVPITVSTVETVDAIFHSLNEDHEADNIVVSLFRSNPILSACFTGDQGEFETWIKVVKKEKFSTGKFFHYIVEQLVKQPDRLYTNATGSIMDRIAALEDCPFSHLISKVGKKLKRKREDRGDDIDEDSSLGSRASDTTTAIPIPYSHQYYDPEIAGKSTRRLCKDLKIFDDSYSTCTLNVIELVGSRINDLFSSIISLSSRNEDERRGGFYFLGMFLRGLALCIEEKATGKFAFREAPQIAMILTWLRNGITAPVGNEVIPGPVPRRICVFVIEGMKILLEPKHDLYTVMYKFILSKPAVNMNSVPLWSSLFYSADPALCRTGRLWIMDVVTEAGEDEDLILSKNGVTREMMTAALHLNATEEEFSKAVRYMERIFASKNLVSELNDKYSFSSWLSLVLRHGSKFLK